MGKVEDDKDEDKNVRTDEDESDDDVNGDANDDDAEAPTVESLQKALEQANRRIGKLNDENKKRRLAERDRADADKDKKPDDPTADLRLEIRQKEAALALVDAGFNSGSKAARKAVKLFDSVDPADVDDEIEELKAQFPSMFGKKRDRKAAPVGQNKGSGDSGDDGKAGGLSEATRKMLHIV